MYFGSVEVKENGGGGGSGGGRHTIDTSKPLLRSRACKTKDDHEQGLALCKQVNYTYFAKTTQDIKEASVQMHTKDTKLHKQSGIN